MYLFDHQSEQLGPMGDLRCSFEVRTGALRTFERLEKQLARSIAGFIVPQRLLQLKASQYPELLINQLDPEQSVHRFINGAWMDGTAPPVPDQPDTAVVNQDGVVISAYLYTETALQFVKTGFTPDSVTTECMTTEHSLLNRPYDLFHHVAKNIFIDAELMTELNDIDVTKYPGLTVVGKHPVKAAGSAVIHPQVVFDTSAGPIVIDEHAEVRSMSVIVGPAYIGAHSAVANHAHLRAGTVIGPVCKVGGEICRCVFQGYANKAHGGYLGDSYVGQWVNLGAGTITSNLKNTYGEIAMQLEPNSKPRKSGLKNLGSIIGDHVKTAIGTRLNTGTCVGTGAMVAQSSITPTFIPAFSFLTDKGNFNYQFDKFCQVVKEVFARREQVLSDEMEQTLKELHTMSAASQTLTGQPIVTHD